MSDPRGSTVQGDGDADAAQQAASRDEAGRSAGRTGREDAAAVGPATGPPAAATKNGSGHGDSPRSAGAGWPAAPADTARRATHGRGEIAAGGAATAPRPDSSAGRAATASRRAATAEGTPAMPPRTRSANAAWRALVDAACAPYRAVDRFAFHFARGKLGGDPVFRHVLERGLIEPGMRVLDVGCGQGLLASLLRAAGAASRDDRWPDGWQRAPEGAYVTGIELMPHDVERCIAALDDDATFICGDMRTTRFGETDAAVIFDALHYIAAAEQDAVLVRVFAALRPGGVLLLRIGDATSKRRFELGQWIDRVSMMLRGGGFIPLAGRPVQAWIDCLRKIGFDVECQPMNGRPPFANVLLIGRRPLGVVEAVRP